MTLVPGKPVMRLLTVAGLMFVAACSTATKAQTPTATVPLAATPAPEEAPQRQADDKTPEKPQPN